MSIAYRFGIILLCIIILPLQVGIAVLIALVDGFPVLYCQKRIGKLGKPFVMYKFRSMQKDADRRQKEYVRRNESDGPVFKIRNDPRFTRLGKILSHTGLDELPQFINVLKGEMSLIGPRPLPLSEAKKLKPWMRVREKVLPGIISPAILTGVYHEDFIAWMRRDVSYVKEKHPRGDVKLFFRSFPFLAKLFVRSVFPHST